MASTDGTDEFTAAIAAMNNRLRAALPQIVRAGADIVTAEIRSRMPVDTGDMKAHLDEAQAGPGDRISVIVQVDESGPKGAERKVIFQEFGTAKMAA